MKVVHDPSSEIGLGAHVWPTAKYRLVHERLAARGAFSFVRAAPATWEDVELVHFPAYVEKLRRCTLSAEEIAQLEIPWNAPIASAFLLMVGGTIATARYALEDRAALHLGGGLHHAFPGHGEGFCPMNDVAIAVRALQTEGRLTRAGIIDCDVHQGNGTAVCFAGDPGVFTFSIHQEYNYPHWKPHSDLDIGVRDRTTDGEYLEQLQEGLEAVIHHKPDLAFYLAGADPFLDDQLGGLALTKLGLRRRDRAVFSALRDARIPVAIVLAGGYARKVEDTVEIHAGTAEEAVAVFSAAT